MATTTCLCDGRGIYHKKVLPGVFEIQSCDCKPVRDCWEEFQTKLKNAKIELGMVADVTPEITGR